MKLLGFLGATCSLPKVDRRERVASKEESADSIQWNVLHRKQDDREILRAGMLGDVNKEVGAVAKAPGAMLSPFKPRDSERF